MKLTPYDARTDNQRFRLEDSYVCWCQRELAFKSSSPSFEHNMRLGAHPTQANTRGGRATPPSQSAKPRPGACEVQVSLHLARITLYSVCLMSCHLPAPPCLCSIVVEDVNCVYMRFGGTGLHTKLIRRVEEQALAVTFALLVPDSPCCIGRGPRVLETPFQSAQLSSKCLSVQYSWGA